MRIGIDLGTTNTVASFIDENGIWNCLEFRRSGSSEDIHFLPSRVACRDGMIVAGRAALETAHRSPGDVIYDAKANMSTPDKQYFIGGMTVTAREASAHILREVYSELSSQFPSERAYRNFTVPSSRLTLSSAICTGWATAMRESVSRRGAGRVVISEKSAPR